MINLKDLNKIDPLKRIVEKDTGQEELSPMEPPEAYKPPNMDAIAYEKMHPFLQKLIDEHKVCLKELDAFEEVLIKIQEGGISKELNEKLSMFFNFLDNNIVSHNLKEEKILFPLLNERLIENGEHSSNSVPKTAVDMLEDDHIKLMQLAAITFNFMGLSGRLPDIASRALVLDAAVEQGKALVELLKLHIFREDNIVFSLAQKFIKKEEFAEMEERLEKLFLREDV